MTHSDIKIKLFKLQKTQRWLLSEVKKRGFPTLHEPLFSDILSGKHPTQFADDVLECVEKILDAQKSA